MPAKLVKFIGEIILLFPLAIFKSVLASVAVIVPFPPALTFHIFYYATWYYCENLNVS